MSVREIRKSGNGGEESGENAARCDVMQYATTIKFAGEEGFAYLDNRWIGSLI